MVTQVMSLTRSGLADFVVQRVTAVILAVYTVVMFAFFLRDDLSHAALVSFFWSTPMQLFSTLAIVSTVAHAWVGMWTIGTDYLRPAHVGGLANIIRFAYQMICLLALFVYIVWALRLVWQF
ncbi:MAG: succinate dehydrogenase, hydrophobic membrane anchor protein [Pseudomonadota bacterium]